MFNKGQYFSNKNLDQAIQKLKIKGNQKCFWTKGVVSYQFVSYQFTVHPSYNSIIYLLNII